MAYCRDCGTQLISGANFCQKCGCTVASASQANSTRRQQEYAGKIIKCPNCGEHLDSFRTICPACGHELREVHASSVVKEFAAKLEAIEAQPDPPKKGFFAALWSQDGLTEKDRRKIELIRSFPIPNTREDLLEFLVIASSNINTDHIEGWDHLPESQKELSNAWKAKFDQAAQKAQLTCGDSQEFRDVVDNYSIRENIREKKQKRTKFWNDIGVALMVSAMLIVGVLGWAYLIRDHNSDKAAVDSENERLELILSEVKECIANEEYAKARALTASLVFATSSDRDFASDARENWENIRQELYTVIDQAEGIYTNTLLPDNTAEDEDNGNVADDTENNDTSDVPLAEEDTGNSVIDAIESGIESFSEWLGGR